MNSPRISPPSESARDIARCLAEVCDRLQRLQPLESATIQYNETSNGVAAEVKPIAGGGSTDTIVAAPLSMVFRGEFSLGLSYSPGDVVVVMGGDNGGQFVATVPVPAGSSEEPGIGNSWFRLSSYSFGQWT